MVVRVIVSLPTSNTVAVGLPSNGTATYITSDKQHNFLNVKLNQFWDLWVIKEIR